MPLDNLQDKFDALVKEVEASRSLADLNEKETIILGRKGVINQWLKELLKTDQISKKKQPGKQINQYKNQLIRVIERQTQSFLRSQAKSIDVTLPGKSLLLGKLHPITLTIEKIVKLFQKIGFYKVSYPEIEYEYFSFDSLNMPSNHPARDEFESFLVDGPSSKKFGKMVLSPHTSSGQVREMLRLTKPPIRMINIARCFRRNFDVTHTPMFHQFEGLCIDRDINIKHLKGAISHFAKEYFGYDSEIRLRPYHFQFTEPSFEVDTTCTLCKGKGVINKNKCRVCKSGWLEVGGAGMVHPSVLKAGKIDPDQYSGWAFGFGVERVYMMKYQLNDLRKLFSGELETFD